MIQLLFLIGLCFMQNNSAAIQPNIQAIAAHIGVISQIKSFFLPTLPVQQKVLSLSQTDAQLSVPSFKKGIEGTWKKDLLRLSPLIDKILHQEKALADNYYVFYHAQQGEFRVVQDIIKELIARMNITGFSDFSYMRSPSDWFKKSQTVEEFLDQEKEAISSDWAFDHNPDIRKSLLSVNISLFGNYDNGGECTFRFFLTSGNVGYFSKKDLLADFFKEYGLNPVFIDAVIDAYNTIKTDEGNLLQICIPKNKVDECVYLSEPFGIPYQKEVVSRVYDRTKKRHTQISPLLELYKKNPELYDRDIQARILITSDTLLNHTSGVKIVSYSTAPEETIKKYQKRIEQLATDIIAEKIEREEMTLNELCKKIKTNRLN